MAKSYSNSPIRTHHRVVNPNYAPVIKDPNGFKSFEDFYPFYIGEHANRTNRRLHIIGSTISILVVLLAVFSGKYILIVAGVVQGYAFAWTGHFFFEKNKPATFEYPLYSFMADFRLLSEVYTWQRPF